MIQNVKPFKSIEEQIEILETKGFYAYVYWLLSCKNIWAIGVL